MTRAPRLRSRKGCAMRMGWCGSARCAEPPASRRNACGAGPGTCSTTTFWPRVPRPPGCWWGAYAGLPDQNPGKLRMLEVLEEYLDTQRFNADRPEAHTNMASVFLALGDFAGAEAALDEALGLEPDWVPALVNLADIYRATNRDLAAGELLERASALAPESAEVKLARALWLVRQGRHPEALPRIARAVELAPDNSHYTYVYAVALHSAGESMRALAQLDATLERRPGDRTLLRAAAGIARDIGDDERMRLYAEKL